ncbi:MAG: chemotaxis protein CheB, partial [Vicinamibacterales bacterium]
MLDSPLPRGLTIVGVGASAGGLEAFTQLVEALPADAGLVVVLLQHMAPNRDSALVYLLGDHAKLPVVEVTDNVRMRANHIYVIPPNVQMEMSGDRLVLSPRPSDRSRHTPIDTFFSSMATAAGNSGIAVVLSGTASDGALGIREVKAAGGITIAQTPASAKFDSMPRAAIATGIVDLILTPPDIGAELVRIAHHPYVRHLPRTRVEEAISDEHLQRIFELLKPVSGVDFRHYKQATIRRRLMRRMALSRIEDISTYVSLLKSSQQEVRGLFQDLLIHVTRFFREPESFAAVTQDVFPKLIKDRHEDQPLRLWVCGCATGEEAYSLAITTIEFLEKAKLDLRVQIFATDVSDSAIEHARAGVYPAAIAADVGAERLRRFFTKTDGNYRVGTQVRDLCVFARQDLTKDPPFSRLDVIMCRNVLIYMDLPLQRKLIGVFHYALAPNGFLILGQAETVGAQASLFAVADKRHRIHRKKAISPLTPSTTFRMGHVPPLLVRKRGAANGGNMDKGFEGEASRVLLERYAPPGVVVDGDLQIVQFRGQTGPYLEPAPGEASLSLLKMAREGLLYGLRTALHAARKSHKPVRKDGLQVRQGDEWRQVTVDIVPLTSLGRPHYLVLFNDAEAGRTADGKSARRATAKRSEKPASRKEAAKMELLHRELAASRDYLQSIIQELEAANEELQSANEEILSSNEELQSTNEELDTAKEELQSSNEELNTLNEELHGRNEEISRANSDLVNLLASVQIAIVIVGPDLRIRRFTPMAEKIPNLIPGDVDRVIGHINPNIDGTNLEQLIIESIDSVTPIERDVRDRQGHWYSLRIRPYKSIENKIDGAVLALFDVDQLKKSERLAQSALGLAAAVLAASEHPMALLEPD